MKEDLDLSEAWGMEIRVIRFVFLFLPQSKLIMPKLLTTKTATLHLTISINAPVNLGLISDQSRQLGVLCTLYVEGGLDWTGLDIPRVVVL